MTRMFFQGRSRSCLASLLVRLDGEQAAGVALFDEVGGVGSLRVQGVHGDHGVGQVGVVDLVQQGREFVDHPRP